MTHVLGSKIQSIGTPSLPQHQRIKFFSVLCGFSGKMSKYIVFVSPYVFAPPPTGNPGSTTVLLFKYSSTYFHGNSFGRYPLPPLSSEDVSTCPSDAPFIIFTLLLIVYVASTAEYFPTHKLVI